MEFVNSVQRSFKMKKFVLLTILVLTTTLTKSEEIQLFCKRIEGTSIINEFTLKVNTLSGSIWGYPAGINLACAENINSDVKEVCSATNHLISCSCSGKIGFGHSSLSRVTGKYVVNIDIIIGKKSIKGQEEFQCEKFIDRKF